MPVVARRRRREVGDRGERSRLGDRFGDRFGERFGERAAPRGEDKGGERGERRWGELGKCPEVGDAECVAWEWARLERGPEYTGEATSDMGEEG